MAEIMIGSNPKVIAFYLPQFHTIPENDKWWGDGFTEWTNVRKAKPLFEGHDQPRVPLNHDYYNLMDDNVKVRQAELAKKFGLFGFCYYHYWFKDGKKLLEKPAEQMLQNKNVDIPFCFSWANENWSRNWDGGNHEIIAKQEYGGKAEWEDHLQYLLPFFRDERYITVEGKPLFIIYKPEQIIDIYQMTKYFRKRIKQEGLPGICLAFQYPAYYSDMYYRDDIFDYRIAFEPVFSRDKRAIDYPGTDRRVKLIRKFFGEGFISNYRRSKEKLIGSNWSKSNHLAHLSYEEAWRKILSNPWTNELLPGAFVDWDNTPRNMNGVVYDGFSIERFSEGFRALVQRTKEESKPMIFINAWNEWGEGAFLEPDEKYRYDKLKAIKKALE